MSKGSLKYHELSELPLFSELSLFNINTINQSCKLVPPIKESCLNADEHSSIEQLLNGIFTSAYQRTMLLYKYLSAAYINGEFYGSINSIHSNSAMIYTKSENASYCPGVSCKYMKINIILKLPNQDNETAYVYLSALSGLQEHPEKFTSTPQLWYGGKLTY